MKNKSISQQLCELCGMKKHRILDKSFCWCNTCKYKKAVDNCQRPGGVECPPHYKLVYPNFEKPENFVKLINIQRKLMLEIWNGIGDGIRVSFHKRFKSYEEEVIEHLIWVLKQPPTPSEYGNNFNTYQLRLRESICHYNDWIWG